MKYKMHPNMKAKVADYKKRKAKPLSLKRVVSLLRVAVAPNGRGVAEIKMPRWWKGAHPDRKHKYLHAKFGRLGWWRFDDVEQANVEVRDPAT